MAKKKTTKKTSSNREPKPGNKRYRRSESELIADLESRIEELRVRQAQRELKQDAGFRAAINADRSIQRAEKACRKAGHTKLANALKAAHFSLAPHLTVDSLGE